MPREILLTNGMTTIVDDDDYEYLSKWEWGVYDGYVIRKHVVQGRLCTVYMHRVIAKTPEGLFTDHINRNRLDNRKDNLRVVSTVQNNMNRRGLAGTSKYKGVAWHRRRQKWQVQIKHQGRTHYLGLFESEHDAALAYNKAATQFYGEFAYLNEVTA